MSEATPDMSRVDLLEAGLEAQIGLLNFDEQKALGERLAPRFGWKMAGDLAVAESTYFRLDEDDYRLTIAALSNLGVGGGLPEYEKVVADVIAAPGQTAVYLGEHAGRGDKPELTFHLPIKDRQFQLNRLIKNFDEKQHYDTDIWHEMWYKQDHNQGRQTPNEIHPVIALNDTTHPMNRQKPANDYNEAGLVYTSEDVEEQRDNLAAEARVASDKFVTIEPMSVSQYLVLQAKRQEAGLPLLDKKTFTRFTQYPNRGIGGYSCVPSARVYAGGQLRLRGSGVDNAWDYRGVRRVVRVA